MNKSAPAALSNLELLQKAAAQCGPFFTWVAIKDCIKDKKEFPEWIHGYLVGCADRMLSDRARLTRDVRQELPWIFGFSGIKGGLNPLQELLRETLKCGFARRFAHWILQGKKPDESLVKARRDIYGSEALVKFIHPRQKRNRKRKAAGEEQLKFSDKQLERDLEKEFQLKTLPRTREEWLPEIYRYLERLVPSDNH